MNIARKGFTLIEILIVVAIIAILASVVLVGLGPTQQAGRDARRLSDLREVQNGLELFYNKCGFYPGTGAPCTSGTPGTLWSDVGADLKNAGIGVGVVPSDPSSNRTYAYGYNVGNSAYAVAALLENQNNSVFSSYTPPQVPSYTWAKDATANAPDTSCPATPNGTYCVSL